MLIEKKSYRRRKEFFTLSYTMLNHNHVIKSLNQENILLSNLSFKVIKIICMLSTSFRILLLATNTESMPLFAFQHQVSTQISSPGLVILAAPTLKVTTAVDGQGLSEHEDKDLGILTCGLSCFTRKSVTRTQFRKNFKCA